MEKFHQKVLNVFDKFGVGKRCSTTYFLEVGAHVSLKLVTKGFLRQKNTESLAFKSFFQRRNGGVWPMVFNGFS